MFGSIVKFEKQEWANVLSSNCMIQTAHMIQTVQCSMFGWRNFTMGLQYFMDSHLNIFTIYLRFLPFFVILSNAGM